MHSQIHPLNGNPSELLLLVVLTTILRVVLGTRVRSFCEGNSESSLLSQTYFITQNWLKSHLIVDHQDFLLMRYRFIYNSSSVAKYVKNFSYFTWLARQYNNNNNINFIRSFGWNLTVNDKNL